MMSKRALVSFVVSMVGLVPGVLAQDTKPTTPPPPTPPAPAAVAAPKPAPSLKAGMPAPEFKVEKFLKGKPFTGLEKGQVYVVEFWATWCGPCIASMPHISELQKEYAEKGVTICGVNIWEDKEYNDGTLPKAEKFVEKKGDGMAYTVAFDGPSKHMDTAWMLAAGRGGIPCAFVVNKEGVIAWIGHPMQLDMVIDEVVKGTWDIEAGDAKVKAAGTAFKDAGGKYTEGLEAGNTAWDEAMKQYPLMGRTLTARRFGSMLAAGHSKEACELGNKIVDDAIAAKKQGPIMEVVSGIRSATAPEVKQLLLKAAHANFDMADKTEYNAHMAMASAYLIAGETEKGREAGKKAIELAPEELKPRLEAWLKQTEEAATKK
jgi:thiol-disulfide isomerase/thioredoxin